MVPPAKPACFTAHEKGRHGYHLVVVGHKFSTRERYRKVLAYRAAELTMEQKASWFTFVESRAKTDTAPVPKRDPAGLRYSFRMDYWRPVWRYKTSGKPGLAELESFRGRSIPHRRSQDHHGFRSQRRHRAPPGPDGRCQPAGFEAGAVSDLLINQVSPPE
jgi:hypothetical protein